MMKTLLTTAALGLSALSFNPAFAHGGSEPKHGGVVQTASDLSFELVGTPGGALIYIEDHGKPLVPTGFKGKLTVLSGANKSEAALVVVDNKLQAKGLQLPKGAKVVAALVTPAAKAITVRFTVR